MRIKSWFKYLIYVFSIVIVVFLQHYILGEIIELRKRTFQFIYFYQLFIMIIFNSGIGLLLGLEQFIGEKKKEGTWKINYPKLIMLGVPSLYFSLGIVIYYLTEKLSLPIEILLKDSTNFDFMNVFQLIFGYSIITSFYKINTEI